MPKIECNTIIENGVYKVSCRSPYSDRWGWMKNGYVPIKEDITPIIAPTSITCQFVGLDEKGMVVCLNKKLPELLSIWDGVDRFMSILNPQYTGFVEHESNCSFFKTTQV